MKFVNLTLVMLVSATTTAVVVFPTDGVFPFHESGTIISGVTYAPLMVSVDLFSVRNMARNFYNTSVVASRNEPLLPRQTLLEFAARPLEQVDEIIGIMEASSFYGRAERQAAAFISVGMSAWALARTYQIQSQVDELAQNQAHLASTVDWMATHMKKEDVFMNTLNKDVRVLAQQQQAIVALVTEFGYFGQARQFSRKIDSLHRGALGLVEGRLSSQLMPAEQLNRAFKQLVRKAKKQGLVPVFPNWQQVLTQETALHYEAGVLTAVHLVPFTNQDRDMHVLWRFVSTPWMYNSSLLVFRPEADYLVTDTGNKSLAQLPNSFLHTCRRIGALHLCGEAVVTAHHHDSCLSRLFNDEVSKAVSSCRVNYLPKQTRYHAVNETSVLVYAPNKTNILETCPDTSEPFMAVTQGLALITSGPSVFSANPGLFYPLWGGGGYRS